MPTTYHIPAAVLLLVGGLLACFAGYRLFRLVLGIYGFILGALAAVSFVSPTTMLATAIVALVGGLIGALVLTFAYFLGVALLGAGLGLLLVHSVWTQQGWGMPGTLALFGFALGGVVFALIFQRYVIIVGTGFGGAWTAVAGAAAMMGSSAARQINAPGNAWIVNPFTLSLSGPVVTAAWFILGLLGIIVQLRARKPRGA